MSPDPQSAIREEVYHQPVMLKEAVEFLAVGKGVYVDATVGGAGHSAAILERLRDGTLIGIDQDPDALEFAARRLQSYPNKRLVRANFADIEPVVGAMPEAHGGVAGILFDLGLSRHQAVTPERGFSYQVDGPLDMRFDQAGALTAADLIRRSSERDIQGILREYGEERFFRRIARQIDRLRGRLSSTGELAEAVRRAVPARFYPKSVMRTFQALRIAVNHELESLRQGLLGAVSLLAENGRVVVIAYHSLEDRIVKQTFRNLKAQGMLAILTRKPLRPDAREVAGNPSARSARLRAAAKLAPAAA